jgi:hypothetical protein
MRKPICKARYNHRARCLLDPDYVRRCQIAEVYRGETRRRGKGNVERLGAVVR